MNETMRTYKVINSALENRTGMIDNVSGCRVYLLTSRNKDNIGVDNFKQRSRSFIYNGAYLNKSFNEKLSRELEYFTSLGAPGETSRLYMSVNTRNQNKIKTELLIKLIKDDGIENRICNIESIVSSIAAGRECADEKKWLLDIDTKDDDILVDIIESYIVNSDNLTYSDISLSRTPNGYALVTAHGFDTRKLLNTYNDVVTVKRDDMLYVCSYKNI